MKQGIGLFILIGMLSACVTINIYFPAAAAQEVADEIIDEVWQLKNDKKEADAPSSAAEDIIETKEEAK